MSWQASWSDLVSDLTNANEDADKPKQKMPKAHGDCLLESIMLYNMRFLYRRPFFAQLSDLHSFDRPPSDYIGIDKGPADLNRSCVLKIDDGLHLVLLLQ